MRVLGIDPGIARVGWAVVDTSSGRHSALEFNCFETSKELEMEKRLQLIHAFFVEILEKYSPDVVAIEQLYFSANAKTALTVGHSRGVILLAASNSNLPVVSFTPLQIKQALTGYGKADKHQIQVMVKSILKIPHLNQDDTADALAVALTYIFSQKMQSLSAAGGFAKR